MGVKLEQWERFLDARKSLNQNGDQSRQVVYDATGIPSSLIQELEKEGSERETSYKKIKALAVHYGVSVDWLLCLSENPSINPEMSSVCKVTGLSETAIKNIQRETAGNDTRLALEVLLCSDSELLHDLCKTVYKALAAYFFNSQIGLLLDSFPSEYKAKFNEILENWERIILDPEVAIQYNSFEAGNILYAILDNAKETTIRKRCEIFGQEHGLGGDFYGND